MRIDRNRTGFAFLSCLSLGGLAACSDPVTAPDPGPLPEGTLLFSSAANLDFEHQNVEIMRVDGADRRTIFDLDAHLHQLALSPGGASLLIVVGTTSGSQIWKADLNEAGVVPLTSTASNFSASWSPDGTRIAFLSDRTAPGNIFVMDLDGKNVVEITSDEDYKGAVTWSPTGETMAYTNRFNGWPDAGSEIWVVPAGGGEGAPLASIEDPTGSGFATTCRHPAWSPDGSRIAFAGQTGTYGDAGGGLWIANADGSNVTQIVPRQASYPAWSPDGEWIVMSRFSTSLEPPGSQAELWIVRPDGTGLRQITDTPEVHELHATWVD